MQSWKIPPDQTQSFDILLFDQFSNHCLANTIEPMRAANTSLGHTRYEWRFLSMDGAAVTSSSGLQITPNDALNAGHGHMLFVMPSYGFRDYLGQSTLRPLKAAAKRYLCVTGLDTGSWLMAKAGLLENHTATIHWDELTNFAEAFPDIDTKRERFVMDQNRITCSGAMAAFDLILHLIGQRHGPLLAMEVAQLFMTQDTTRPHPLLKSAKGKLTNAAIAVMQAHLETPLTIPQIAHKIGTSQRQLDARMKSQFALTPQAIYKSLRLTQAHKLLLETNHSISEIAGRCGYENASAMTRAFKTQFQTTPTALRESQT